MNLPQGWESAGVEALCDACGKPTAALRIEANLVAQRDRPQNKVLAITVSAARTPPTVTQEVVNEGRSQIVSMPNPKHNPVDRVIVATWEQGTDICFDRDCYLNALDELWRLVEKRVNKMWEEEREG